MPPTRKYSREDIVDAAYRVVSAEGMADFNARRIAGELGCSTQPIYHNFSSMSALMDAVIQRAFDFYMEYIKKGLQTERPYLGSGLAYIRFARDNPRLYELLFMNKSDLSAYDFVFLNDKDQCIINVGKAFTGLSEEEQREFHLKVWVFTHGLASLEASQTVNFTDDQIEQLLITATREMLIGYKEEKTSGKCN